MSIAIITGASGGIGSEFARQLAGLGICDEFWFVARNEERMKKADLKFCLPCDSDYINIIFIKN